MSESHSQYMSKITSSILLYKEKEFEKSLLVDYDYRATTWRRTQCLGSNFPSQLSIASSCLKVKAPLSPSVWSEISIPLNKPHYYPYIVFESVKIDKKIRPKRTRFGACCHSVESLTFFCVPNCRRSRKSGARGPGLRSSRWMGT